MESITVTELKEKILDANPVNIVDVRTDQETAMGIIPGAETIPMNSIPDNLNYFNDNETMAYQRCFPLWGKLSI